MLREPCERLARCIGLATDVGSTGRILEHRVVRVVLARLAGICAQPLDTEVTEAESLNLWDVDCSVAVNEVGRRTVGLVAGDGSMTVSPCRPLLSEVLEDQVAKSLAIVGENGDGFSSVPRWSFYGLTVPGV